MATRSVSKQLIHVFLSFISEKVLGGVDKKEGVPVQRLLSAKPRSNLSADVIARSSVRSPVPATRQSR